MPKVQFINKEKLIKWYNENSRAELTNEEALLSEVQKKHEENDVEDYELSNIETSHGRTTTINYKVLELKADGNLLSEEDWQRVRDGEVEVENLIETVLYVF